MRATRTLLTVTTCVAALAAAGGCGSEAPGTASGNANDQRAAVTNCNAQGGAVAGTITGTIAGGVALHLEGRNDESTGWLVKDTTSRPDGTYCFEHVSNGTYTVTPSAEGHRFYPLTLQVHTYFAMGDGVLAGQDFQAPECVALPASMRGPGNYMDDYQGGCPAGQVCDTGKDPLPAPGHCIPSPCPLPSPLSCSLGPCPDGYVCDMTKTGAGPQCACMADGSWMCEMAAYPGACVKQ